MAQNSIDDYRRFLARKVPAPQWSGFDPAPLPDHLFPHQRACIDFNIRVGSGGLFLDTGLGKTACQLEWLSQCAARSNGRGLLLTPLAVTRQIEREALKWGYPARVVRSQDDAREGINICNYDRLDRLDPAAYGAVSLDESSILKSFTGKTTRALIDSFSGTRYRLSATATPAPNDHMELGQHAEFCGIMPSNEMLMRWFISDQTEMGRYRLKGHAITAFWDWMASWCRLIQLPSDLGFDDDGFALPPLETFTHLSESVDLYKGDDLFGVDVVSATTMHGIKRQTAEARAKTAVDLVTAEPSEPWVVWCDTDYEADALLNELRGVPSVVEVRGSHAAERKESALESFADGSARVLITKPSVCGFGLNWQHCARTVFVGRSFSYESWYQAVRRFWRFGQTRPVHCHVIVAQGEQSIGRVIDRKAADHAEMKKAMRAAMRRDQGINASLKVAYLPKHEGRLPQWLNA